MFDAAAKRFLGLAKFFSQKKEEEEKQYGAFLKFYETLVRETPTEAVKKFEAMDVRVVSNGSAPVWDILLTPTDFVFWKTSIENEGVRFVNGPVAVQTAMLNRMSGFAEQLSLTAEERSRLLDIIMDRA